MADLRDLAHYGKGLEDFKEVSSAEFKKLKNKAQNWYNDPKSINPKTKKKPKGLKRWKGGTRFIIHNGQALVLYTKGRNVEAMPYKKYMDKLTQASGIPKSIFAKLESDSGNLLNEIAPEFAGKYPEGFEMEFKKWFKKYVTEQKGEQQFYRDLGKLYVDAGLEKDAYRQSLELDRSHYWPKSKDGIPFTFLENWLVNQRRGAREFISLDNLRKGGIPTTWNELIDTVYKELYEVNPDGTPWHGPLGRLDQISQFDAAAMVRGEDINTIVSRYKELDAIREAAFDDPKLQKKLQPRYQQLLSEARGPDYSDIKMNSLSEDIGLMKRIIENKALKDLDTSDFDTEVDSLHKQNIPDEFKSSNKFGGGGPETTISPDPPTISGKKAAGILGTGLTIKGLAGNTALSAINPETGYHAGVLASGEGNISNVQGAATGIGKDLLVGGTFNKALQMATSKAATHFGGKALLGKAVPYVGWGMLGYGVYDTANAFAKGLTGKSFNERIGETYQRIIDEEFDESKNWSDRHTKDQDLNFTTM